MAWPLIIAAAVGGAYVAEKIGDWWNTENSIAPQPIYQPPGNLPPSTGVTSVILVGMALTAAGVWYVARKK